MLQGALIGVIVAIVMTAITVSKQKKRKQGLLDTMRTSGPEAARTALDRSVAALVKIPMSKIMDQKDRMAGLTIIGHVDALENEVSGHTGKLTCIAQVNAVGLLGLAIRNPDPADAANRLDALATRMENEGGAMMKLVKQQIRTYANLAKSIAGTPMAGNTATEVEQLAKKEPQLVRIILIQGLAQAIEAAGGDGNAMRMRVRESTTAFDVS